MFAFQGVGPCLKKGKCCDDAKINAEHFFFAPLSLFDRITALFQQMMLHGYVPHQFQSGTIVPIVKDRQGDCGDMNNYRGITIAPILSKIFEHALKIVFQPFLTNTDLGLKRSPRFHMQYFVSKKQLTIIQVMGAMCAALF